MTGAVMPSCCDTVIMQERAKTSGEQVIVGPGQENAQNVRYAGADIKAGAVVFARGQLIRPAELGMIASFQVFTSAFLMTGGGPEYATYFLVMYIYQEAFKMLHMGGGAALAWILFIIILVIGVINLFITRNLVRDEGSRNTLTRSQMRAARRAARAAVAADRVAASAPRRTNEASEVTR